ncbi:MAG: hypothetical protein GX051_03855 [Clostridiales bacterium]|nr:hypothetical protein [Clostridiales bacterium]
MKKESVIIKGTFVFFSWDTPSPILSGEYKYEFSDSDGGIFSLSSLPTILGRESDSRYFQLSEFMIDEVRSDEQGEYLTVKFKYSKSNHGEAFKDKIVLRRGVPVGVSLHNSWECMGELQGFMFAETFMGTVTWL